MSNERRDRKSRARDESRVDDGPRSTGDAGSTGDAEIDARRQSNFARKLRFRLDHELPGIGEVDVPSVCPVLGTPFESLEDATVIAVVPERGFVSGNVCVVSRRAALFLSVAATAEQHELCAAWRRERVGA